MPVTRRHVLGLTGAAIAAAVVTVPGPAAAQAWPTTTVRLVVPFAPGGSADAAARLLAPRLAERLGQQVIVENRPGAGGALAIGQVAKATPDGHTIMLAAAGGLTISPTLNPRIGYDPLTDLAPITGFARIPFVLIASGDLPVTDAKGLIDYARRNPGRLTYASAGNGTAMHIGGEMFKSMTDSFVVHIPYRGSGPAAMATMAGETSLAVVDLTSVRGQRENPRLKMLAMLSRERSTLAPDLPTLHEVGLSGFDVSGWFGLYAPAATPAAVVQRLNTEITALLRDPGIVDRFKTMGMEAMPTTSDQLASLMRSEITAYKAVIQRAGIKAE
jgi:tripartite-type tricarboxylate transporter receptor subunit TctC